MAIQSAGERFDAFLKQLEEEDKRKVDTIAPINSLRVEEDFTFTSDELGRVKMTDYAFGQLCQNVYDYTLPVEYFKKLYEDDPQRFAEQMNFHLENGRGVNRRFRMMKDAEDDILELRGIVSERFIPYDNLDVLSIFMDTAKELPEFEVMNNFSNENMMFLRIGFPTESKTFGQTFDGSDDRNFLAIDLLNSEVGSTSIIANPAIFRLICTNGMVAKKADYGLFKQRHIHINPMAVNEGLRHSILSGVANGRQMLDKFGKARDVKLDNPYEELEGYGKKIRLSNKMMDTLKSNFEIEREKSLFSVVNAFTRTATGIENIDKRLEMERFASKVLEDGLKVS